MEVDYAPFFRWVEQHRGGRIVRNERQGDRRSGGRPAFFLDVETPSGIEKLYARMSRSGQDHPANPFGLAREGAILEVVHRAGIAVPEPRGVCPKPTGLLLECVPGEFDYTKLASEAERDAVDRSFLAQLVALHELDAGAFEAIGLFRPRTADEFALADLAVWEAGFDRSSREPVPLVRFARQWLHRNVPAAPERAVLVQGDTGPGQFLFEDGRVTGIVDWEFAHLADPMLDLAQVRARDFYNPGADVPKWIGLYAELGGAPIDWPRLCYYTVKAMVITPLALAGIVQKLTPESDHAEWIAQDVSYQRATMQALAEAIGVELEPPAAVAERESAASRGFELLLANLEDEQRPAIDDGFLRSRMDLTLRLARHLHNRERMGEATAERERDEMAELLGKRPPSVETGNRELDAFVEAAGPERDAELVRYFYRHACREEALMRGALGAGEGAVFTPLR